LPVRQLYLRYFESFASDLQKEKNNNIAKKIVSFSTRDNVLKAATLEKSGYHLLEI
jgi:hypothetical protein